MTRRYDIDWLRVFAIFLLIIYHITIMFQPWAFFIGFIKGTETNESLFTMMTVVNVWRIPLLFFVSGMGVMFSLRKRNWKQLLGERTKRILLPLVFGYFAIVPLHLFVLQDFYNFNFSYSPNLGHLWFLLNIFIYVIIFIGFAFLDRKYDYAFFRFIRKMLNRSYMVYLFVIPFVLESFIVQANSFTTYFDSTHGFLLGMICFATGMIFIAVGDEIWTSLDKLKVVSLVIAIGLYVNRVINFDYVSPNYLFGLESIMWIFTILGFGYRYLNKPSRALGYLSRSVYPVYIVHMIFSYLAGMFIFQFQLDSKISFLLVLIISLAGCYAAFEIIRRIKYFRMLFGITG